MQILFRGILWFGLYVTLALLPIAVVLLADDHAAPRSFAVEFGVAIGLIAFAVMTFEFALVGRLREASRPFGIDALMQFHRQMGVVACLLLLVHVGAVLFGAMTWAAFNPFSGTSSGRAGAIALWALVVLATTSLGRKRLRLRYETWQRLHAFAALLIVMASLQHMLAVNHYLASAALRGLLLGYVALFFLLLLRYRVFRAMRLSRRPWRVVGNRDEGGDTRTLVLESSGHEGLRFEPGQFVWLSTARSPWSMEQHPVSIASSAEKSTTLELSIKALGDWSRDVVPRIEVGRSVWVDGSYGAFTPDRLPAQGLVLIAGGVGITPMRSILLTMRDREDVRPVTLIYAAHSPERMVFVSELLALQQSIHLKCVFVYEAPPPDWTGERGFVTTELLQRHLPPHAEHFEYLVCGPAPMMNAVERSLLSLGLSGERICTERFDMD